MAACGRELLIQNTIWRERLCGLLRQDTGSLLDLVTVVIALHDIGKFSKPFQIKSPRHWPADLLGPPDRYRGGGLPHHDTAGWWLWTEHLEAVLVDHFDDPVCLDPLLRAATGHHGSPPEENCQNCNNDQIGSLCIKAAQVFAADTAELILSKPVALAGVPENDLSTASFLLAGLTTLADWIGSNQTWFPYCPDKRPLGDYWQNIARECAPVALREAGLAPHGTARRFSYQDLVGESDATPMQDWARKVDLTDGPGLYLIEDMTGSGKTEAALMLAYRMMSAGKADGLYFALPTQATANGIYQRLANSYRALFKDDTAPSLILAHGARDLSERFTDSILTGAGEPEPAYGGAAPLQADDSDITASAQCAGWIADDRRLSFLADVGAGTIDQALLAILPNRHQALRLAGLVRRVLILDEIHAYDSYMLREIETLLAFHRALGGSAILLSATLPDAMKQRLCAAYGGAAIVKMLQETDPNRDQPYPLATVVSRNNLETHDIEPRDGSSRTVKVRFLRNPDEALEHVMVAARDGQAVLYIRNTVQDATNAFERLAAELSDVFLFHARFAYCDRLRQEQKTIDTFGKDSTAEARAGQVLVATQVVEQSLDLDFDLIISDLAPVDLLIQRAGRLWRHRRDGRPGKCELLVVGPEPEDDPAADWLKSAMPGTAAVYRDHARLWLTARLLREHGAIRSPDNQRQLVEQVYGGDAELDVPDGLRDSFYDFEGQQGADRGIAGYNVLRLSAGYTRDGGRWDSDERTPTRLGADSVIFRLARLENGQLQPWSAGQETADMEPWRLWRLSEIALARTLADDVPAPPPELAGQAARILEGWGKWHTFKKLLILTPGDQPQAWRGTVMAGKTSKDVAYTLETGLTFLPH